MFQKPTVLILGAGASVPFGFPTGIQLKERIIGRLKAQGSGWREVLHKLNFTNSDIDGFINDLQRSGNSSVDAFIEKRTDLMNIGKVAIALGIIECEITERLYSSQDNWYRYVYDIMTVEGNNYGNNELSIITFNYDRSFEEFMYSALKAELIEQERVKKEIDSIPVIHVYGSLGPLNNLDYSNDIKHYRVKIAASQGIQIVSEADGTSPEFEQALKILDNATWIYFLGFGYNPVNLKRLKIDDANYSAVITGSCYGLGFTEVEAIQALKSRIHLNNSDCELDVLNYLKNNLRGYF